MDWVPVILFSLLLLYGCIAWYTHRKKIREDIITFYGPVMAVKTRRVEFLDRFRASATVLRIYGSVGIAMVVVVSVAMTILVFLAFHQEVERPPAPEGIFSFVNWFAIPGVNQFIPFTIPVLLALAITIAVHELGHGVLCRVEGIPVRSMGVLLLVIPFGFFVEPDEEELERAPPIPKSRMFGAGIMNNIVAGLACFALMVLLFHTLAPIPGPIIYMTAGDYPAYQAGVPLGSVITEVDGRKVSTISDVAGILTQKRPGDTVTLSVVPAELVRARGGGEGTTYTLNLTSSPDRDYRDIGVRYYNSKRVLGILQNLASPYGLLLLGYLPVDILENQVPDLHLIFMDGPDLAFYETPFPFFWGVAHFLFWCGWFNFMVGTFNALPMVPFDGGFIMREGVEGLSRRLGTPRLAERLVLTISLFILTLLILILAIPYIARLFTLVGQAA